MNKITRETAKEMGIDFENLISDMEIISYEEHRRGSNFYTRSVVEIKEEWFPEVPRELDGFWETNTYVSDSDWGHESSEIYELNRVEKKVKVVETTYWEKIN
jgi:hypothetical protein